MVLFHLSIALIILTHAYFLAVSPKARIGAVNQTYSDKYSAVLTCHHSGGAGNKVQWLKGAKVNLTEENDTLLVENDTLHVEGAVTGENFTCIVNNSAGSDQAVFVVRPLRKENPSHKNVQINEEVALCCNIRSYPPPQYEWFKANSPSNPIENSSSSCLDLGPVQFGDEGYYYCEGSSNNESRKSKKAKLTSEPQSLVFILYIIP